MEQRKVVPEILDQLAAGDPEAVRSRRELRLINGVMGNWRWLSRELETRLRPGIEVVELGSGDAEMARRHLPDWVRYRGIDRVARPAGLPRSWDWEQRDVLQGGALPGRLLVANLFLHHLSNGELRQLASLLSPRVEGLFVCEPCRHPIHLWQGRLLCLLGLSRVTRHDMQVSIKAGFRLGELPGLLGLQPGEWEILESWSFFGALRMRAVRRRNRGSDG